MSRRGMLVLLGLLGALLQGAACTRDAGKQPSGDRAGPKPSPTDPTAPAGAPAAAPASAVADTTPKPPATLTDVNPGQVFAQPAERLDSLPDGIFHHIELRVRVEEAVGGGLATREVLKYSARAADLSGADLILGHEAGQGAEANRLRPYLLVRPQMIEGEWLWLKPPAAGNASVSMVDALGGSAEEAAGTVTAETIELDFANPDGSGETVIREVFDHVGKHRRKTGTALSDEQVSAAASSLSVADFTTNVYDLFFTTGVVDPPHLMHLVAQPDGNPDRIDISAGLHRMALAYTTISDALTTRVVGRSGAVVRLHPDTPRLTIAEVTMANGTPRLSEGATVSRSGTSRGNRRHARARRSGSGRRRHECRSKWRV